VASFGIKRQESKTGTKKERVIRKLSVDEAQAGHWARDGGAHHFYINGVSVCNRPLRSHPDKGTSMRKLCAECYSALSNAIAHGAI